MRDAVGVVPYNVLRTLPYAGCRGRHPLQCASHVPVAGCRGRHPLQVPPPPTSDLRTPNFFVLRTFLVAGGETPPLRTECFCAFSEFRQKRISAFADILFCLMCAPVSNLSVLTAAHGKQDRICRICVFRLWQGVQRYAEEQKNKQPKSHFADKNKRVSTIFFVADTQLF